MKSKTTAEKKYLTAKAGSISLKCGVFLCPIIPGVVITCVNAGEWFASKPYSIGLGFASLIITILVSILMVYKKSEIFKTISKLWGAVIVLVLLGVTFLFLAEIADNLGMMFLATACGVCGSSVCNEVDKRIIMPKVEYQKEIINAVGLDRKANALAKKKANDIARAKEEAENIGGIL